MERIYDPDAIGRIVDGAVDIMRGLAAKLDAGIEIDVERGGVMLDVPWYIKVRGPAGTCSAKIHPVAVQDQLKHGSMTESAYAEGIARKMLSEVVQASDKAIAMLEGLGDGDAAS